MARKKSLKKQLKLFDQKRRELKEAKVQNIPFLYILPVISCFIAYVISLNPTITFFSTIIVSLVSLIYYKLSIESKFRALKGQVKSRFINKFMSENYPDINYKYSAGEKSASYILGQVELSTSGIIKEEDVITGTYNSANFYFSEIKISNEEDKTSSTLFNGILFELRLPGRKFPKTRILSKRKISQVLFSKFKEDSKHKLWYETSDELQYQNTLKNILPFIAHLKLHQGDIRIQAEGNRITIVMEAKMNFLDEPEMSLNKSFDNKLHQQNIGSQLKTLLFIIDAFVYDLDKKEIEEKLELRELEPIELKIKPKRKS